MVPKVKDSYIITNNIYIYIYIKRIKLHSLIGPIKHLVSPLGKPT